MVGGSLCCMRTAWDSDDIQSHMFFEIICFVFVFFRSLSWGSSVIILWCTTAIIPRLIFKNSPIRQNSFQIPLQSALQSIHHRPTKCKAKIQYGSHMGAPQLGHIQIDRTWFVPPGSIFGILGAYTIGTYWKYYGSDRLWLYFPYITIYNIYIDIDIDISNMSKYPH